MTQAWVWRENRAHSGKEAECGSDMCPHLMTAPYVLPEGGCLAALYSVRSSKARSGYTERQRDRHTQLSGRATWTCSHKHTLSTYEKTSALIPQVPPFCSEHRPE